MSIIEHVTLQKIVAHDFRYDPRIKQKGRISIKSLRPISSGTIPSDFSTKILYTLVSHAGHMSCPSLIPCCDGSLNMWWWGANCEKHKRAIFSVVLPVPPSSRPVSPLGIVPKNPSVYTPSFYLAVR